MIELLFNEKYSKSDVDFDAIIDEDVNVIVPENIKDFSINLRNIFGKKNLSFTIGENSLGTFNVFFKSEDIDLKITLQSYKNSNVIFNVVDFIDANRKIVAQLDLLDENAKCVWNTSSLASKNTSKSYTISFLNYGEKTVSLMNNYGVCKDNSILIFDGVSHIDRHGKKSEAKQNAKIIIFDKNCKAVANPSLLIDYNDIVANHSAAVGTLNQDHIYYLLSRGLELKEARKLITLGYLKPILRNIDEEDAKNNEELLGDLM